jgi:hypothetical protein
VLDHHHPVGGLGDLGQQVAGHQDRPALAAEAAQQLAQPSDALGIETVGGLIEDQHLGITQQCRREAEPLPHTQ